MTTWQSAPPTGLEAEIATFKAALPGWWFSLGECQVSADASCGPTSESEHIQLIGTADQFDSGFHADLPQPATLAQALRDVREQALSAIKEAVPNASPAQSTPASPDTANTADDPARSPGCSSANACA